VKNFIGMVCA